MNEFLIDTLEECSRLLDVMRKQLKPPVRKDGQHYFADLADESRQGAD